MFIFPGCKISHRDIKPEKFYWYYKTRKINKILIDTRLEQKYKKDKIPGAKNIQLSGPDFKATVKQAFTVAPKDVWVIFVYAQDKNETGKLKSGMGKLYKSHIPFKGPTAIYYLKDGYKYLPLNFMKKNNPHQ